MGVPGGWRRPEPWLLSAVGILVIVLGFVHLVRTTPAPAAAPRYSASVTIATGLPADRKAVEENLRAQPPNPFVIAIRSAVGPDLSEDELNDLSRYLNLLLMVCPALPAPEQTQRLVEHGLDAVTARRVLAAVRPLSTCPS